MQIPNEDLEKWARLKTWGDLEKMRQACGIKMAKTTFYTAVSRMMKNKQGPDYLFEIVRDFYDAKDLKLFPKKTTSNE